LSRKYFSFEGAVELVSATAGLHADTHTPLLTITELTKAETTR
jgi:hypothetical protein